LEQLTGALMDTMEKMQGRRGQLYHLGV